MPITHTTNGDQAHDIDDPLRTITTAKGGEFALVSPVIVGAGGAVYAGKPQDPAEPINTITANSRFAVATAVVAPIIDSQYGNSEGYDISQPSPTVTAGGGGKQALVAATLMGCGGRAGQSRPRGLDEPLATATAKADVCIAEATLEPAERVAAFIAQHNGGSVGNVADAPISTVVGRGTQQQLCTSHLIKLRGTCADGQPVDEPAPTITASGTHVGEVRAFLAKYYGDEHNGQSCHDPLHTVTTKERFGLVTVTIEGEDYVIVDIGMRMLTPRELARAQGFPDSYILDPMCTYTTESGARKTGHLPKTHQIAKIGNSVCPVMAEVLTRANCGMYVALERDAA